MISSVLQGLAGVGNLNGNTVVTMNNSPILVFTGVEDMSHTVSTVIPTVATSVTAGKKPDEEDVPEEKLAPAPLKKEQTLLSEDSPAVAIVGNANGNTVVTLNNSPILVFTAVKDMSHTIDTVIPTIATSLSTN